MATRPYPGWHRVYEYMAYVKDGNVEKYFDAEDPEAVCTVMTKPVSIEVFKNAVYYQRRKKRKKEENEIK